MQIFTPKPVTGRSDVFMYVLVTSCHDLSGTFKCDGCFIRICYKNKFFQKVLCLV